MLQKCQGDTIGGGDWNCHVGRNSGQEVTAWCGSHRLQTPTSLLGTEIGRILGPLEMQIIDSHMPTRSMGHMVFIE